MIMIMIMIVNMSCAQLFANLEGMDGRRGRIIVGWVDG